MTESLPRLESGDRYIVFFHGGPHDGQTDRRIATGPTFVDEITVLAAVDGKETLIEYTLTDFATVGGEHHVNYRFDAEDSEPIEAPEHRGGRQ